MVVEPSIIGYTLRGARYLNVTNRCTLRCSFCPKFNGEWHVKGYPLRLRHEPGVPEMIEAAGDAKQWREVVFCGLGEPTLRLYEVLETARELRHRGAKVRLNTDGLANLVHARDVTADFEGSFDAVSVSLNAQNEALYNTHCRPALPGAYDAAQEFVRRVREFVPRVTVTAIDGLPGVDVPACEARAKELGAGFRRRVLGRVG